MTNKKGLNSTATKTLLDLPESILDNILICLSPLQLCTLSQVCNHLRHRCTSDYLWEKLLTQKWGRLIGGAARQEWNWHLLESRKRGTQTQTQTPSSSSIHNGSLGTFTGVWPSLYLGSYLKFSNTSSIPDDDSVMALYIALETGRFWFPAQAYTRDGGVRVLCSDVLISYQSRTNTFRSRYRHDGWRKIEDNIPWDMVRASPVDTLPNVPYSSDCLNDLQPMDHIEVQWRGSKGVPYDWWYATIGHLGSCNGLEYQCSCQYNDMLMVEFKQYVIGSPFRQVVLNKKHVGEQFGRGGGCYGGIRKLRNEEEIARWKMLLDN